MRLIRLSLIAIVCILPLAGCSIIGVLAAKTMKNPAIEPEYTNFQNQTLAIWVWADEGTQNDFEPIHLDVGNTIQAKLDLIIKGSKKQPTPKHFQGASFRWPAASVVRFQRDHPEVEAQPIEQVAPRLGVTRLIFVEISGFQTRADTSVDLYRGTATCTLKVIEVKDGKGTVAYQKEGIHAVFPEKAPQEGLPSVGDRKIYVGLLDQLSTEIVHRFVRHDDEE